MWEKLNQLKQQYENLNLSQVINYEKFSIISIVWHSTKIEGCSLTETDTKVLLEKDITAAGKPLQDHLMIKDHYAAFMFIKEQAQLKRTISVEFIQEINAWVMKNTGTIINTALGSFDTSKGDLRLVQVYVDKKYFPDYKKVPMLMQEFCSWANEKLVNVAGEEIIKLAADVHYNFINIHPFADGNGRVARLLMNYIQLYHQQPLIKIFTEDRAAYIDALNEAEVKENLQIFREFIGQQEIKFLTAEIEKYNEMDKDFKMIKE